jgi:hypothetical protein
MGDSTAQEWDLAIPWERINVWARGTQIGDLAAVSARER